MSRLSQQILDGFHGLPVFVRKSLVLAIDVFLILAAFATAVYLRFGHLNFFNREWIIEYSLILLLVSTIVVAISGLPRSQWRYASLPDFVIILRTVTVTVVVHTLLLFAVSRLDGLARSIPLLTWFIGLVYLSGPRVVFRLLRDGSAQGMFSRSFVDPSEKILLFGSTDIAELFIRNLRRKPDAQYEVAGIFTEEKGLSGSRIHGVNILGSIDALENYFKKQSETGSETPNKVVLTSRDISIDVVRELVRLGSRSGFVVERLPSMDRFESGEQILSPNADFKAVELEDVLGRPSVKLDLDGILKMIEGRRVMVTGAGGSIGAELTRQIASYKPSHLTMIDSSEFNLFAIDRDIREHHAMVGGSAIVCSVRNRDRIFRIMEQEKPTLVFHAAALKHVPLVELNPGEGVLTNVAGTRNVADAALKAGVDGFVMVSTDKAVNPTNIMGATKRLAEQYCQSLDLASGYSKEKKTRFLTVRFGNVLGSAGSVIPHFERQIRRGGPVTVTHPEIERYFMTIREAVELILQATSHGLNTTSETGQIYVLEMGQPIKIRDLARQMVRLAGLEPDRDVSIIYTGLRPGEKLMEELFVSSEPIVPVEVDGLICARARPIDMQIYNRTLDELVDAARADDNQKLATLIARILPEYTPSRNAELYMQEEAPAAADNAKRRLRLVENNYDPADDQSG